MPQVKAPLHITTLFFLGELNTECWNFPRLPLQCFNYQLFSFPGKRKKTQQELTDFSNILKGEFHYKWHHVMAKNPKPTQITASKTSSTDGTWFSRAVTRSSGQTWMELWWFWGPDKGKAQPRKQDSKKQDTHLLLHLKQQNPDQNCRLSGWVILWVKDATQGWEKEFKVFASKIPVSASLPVWGLSWTSQPLPNCAKQQH